MENHTKDIVPAGYPVDCKDREIKGFIHQLATEIKGDPSHAIHYGPLIQLGQNELASRLARRNAYLVLSISGLSIILSFMAVSLSIESNESSVEWRESQLESLRIIEESLKR